MLSYPPFSQPILIGMCVVVSVATTWVKDNLNYNYNSTDTQIKINLSAMHGEVERIN